MPRLTTFAILLLSTVLCGVAAAQPSGPPLAPPSGPVDPGQPGVRIQVDRSMRMDRRGQRGDVKRRIPPALRAQLIARFDRDGDGRLTGPERRQAKKFLRHLRKQQQRGGRRGGMR